MLGSGTSATAVGVVGAAGRATTSAAGAGGRRPVCGRGRCGRGAGRRRRGGELVGLLEREVGERGDRLLARGAPGEVDLVAGGLQGERGHRERPDVVAEAARGAEREPDVHHVLLAAVEDRVQPRPELRELARVPRELAVDAVDRERGLQHDRAADQPGARAQREQGGRHEAHPHRDRRHLVRRQPVAGAPPRDVPRVGADEERREEPVRRLDGRVERGLVLVALGQLGLGLGGGRARGRAGVEEAAQVGVADVDAAADEADEQHRRRVLARDALAHGEQSTSSSSLTGGCSGASSPRGQRRPCAPPRRAAKPAAPVPDLAGELRGPGAVRLDVGGADRAQRAQALGGVRERGEVAGIDLQDAQEVVVGAADAVVGRARGHDPAAQRARPEGPAARARGARAEDPGNDAGVGEQAGQRLAVHEQVGAGDDEGAGRAPGQVGGRGEVAGQVVAGDDLGAAGAVVERGPDLGGPGRAGHDRRAPDPERGQLGHQPAGERRALGGQERRRAAVGGRCRREEHGGGGHAAVRARGREQLVEEPVPAGPDDHRVEVARAPQAAVGQAAPLVLVAHDPLEGRGQGGDVLGGDEHAVHAVRDELARAPAGSRSSRRGGPCSWPPGSPSRSPRSAS